MKSEIENSIGGEIKEMKERLDTLTATLEENKDEGQLWFQNRKKFTITGRSVKGEARETP